MNNSPKVFLIIAAALLLTPPDLQARERFALRGHVELGGSVDFTNFSFSDSSNSTGVFSIAPYIGYFIVNQVELGIRPMVTIVSPPSGKSTTDLAIFFAPSLNFSSRSSIVTPFIEGLIGFSSVDITTVTVNPSPQPGFPATTTATETVSGLAYGGRGGVKVQVSDYGLLNFAIQYVSLDRTPEKATSNLRENRLSVSLGFSLFTY